jgi:hypothetical protein
MMPGPIGRRIQRCIRRVFREIWQSSEAFAISEGAGGEPCRPDHPNAHAKRLDSTESMRMREYPIGVKRKRCRLSLSAMQAFDSGRVIASGSGWIAASETRRVGHGTWPWGSRRRSLLPHFRVPRREGECTPANHTPGQGWGVTHLGCESPEVVIEGVDERRA